MEKTTQLKKYCRDCKHRGLFSGNTEFCDYRPERKYEEKGSEYCGPFKKAIRNTDEKIIFPAYKFELNKEGGCPYYAERSKPVSEKITDSLLWKYQSDRSRCPSKLHEFIKTVIGTYLNT